MNFMRGVNQRDIKSESLEVNGGGRISKVRIRIAWESLPVRLGPR